MAYDRIDWHSGGDFPADLPEACGGTHIGMFLAWAFANGLASDEHKEDAAEDLARLARRDITGCDFLLTVCDGKFWADDLNDMGQAFATDYYAGESAFATAHGQYMDDYCAVFNEAAAARGTEYPSVYHVEDTWAQFDLLAPTLAQRFAQWQAWRNDPAQASQDPKTQFLAACAVVGAALQRHGFKANKAGTVWKKTAADKDTVFHLRCDPLSYNTRSNVRLTVSMRITSRSLKRWLHERTDGWGDDLVLLGGLCEPSKLLSRQEWQVAGSQAEASTQAIIAAVESQILPIFNRFEDRPQAIAYLAEHSGEFAGVSEPSAMSLAFVLRFGTPAQAQQLVESYFHSRPSNGWRRNIRATFEQLDAGEDIAWSHSTYYREFDMKLAWHAGLHLPAAGADKPTPSKP